MKQKEIYFCPYCGSSWILINGNSAFCRDKKCLWQGWADEIDDKFIYKKLLKMSDYRGNEDG